jgi:WS/DGAT/MGAT family acyltransferase
MAERETRFERRMSDAEALMWNLEKDPSLRSTFVTLTFLDQAPSFEGFRRRMARAVAELPRLRQRVVSSPARMAPPEWQDDPSFDLDFHVRRIGLAAPGTDRQLLDFAAADFQDPFDRARPLWRYTIVEGLTGGRAALLAKMHHTITDGVGGIRLSAMFIDLEREADDPPLPEQSPFADSPEGIVSDITDALLHGLRRQLGMTRRTAANVVDLLLHPERVPRQAADVIEIGRSVLRQLIVTDHSRSPLWTGRRSLGRHFEVLSVDLDRLKEVANALEGTVNDAFVCGVAGGAGAYHRAKGVEVDELRVSMPISTRTDKSAGGNSFTPTRALVPAGTKDPVERFEGVRARLSSTKSERAVGFTNAFAGILNALPTSVVVNVVRQQVETVDFATSNLRGAPWDLYIAGAEIVGNHPMGPTGGTAFNATVLSYRGTLDMGINMDTAAIDEPGLLRDCIAESFDELLTIKG